MNYGTTKLSQEVSPDLAAIQSPAAVKAPAAPCFVCERPVESADRLQGKPVGVLCSDWLVEKANARREGLERMLLEVTSPHKPRFVRPDHRAA